MNKSVKNTKVPQTVDEYNAAMAKLLESISDKRADAISSGIVSVCTAGVGYMINDVFRTTYGDDARAVIYCIFGLCSMAFIGRMVNKLGMAAILQNTYREMEMRRNQLKKSMVKTNER